MKIHTGHRKGNRRLLLASFTAAAMVLLAPAQALAHCDGLDGPVVKAARDAIARGDIAPVLIWVRKDDEPAIRSAFAHATSVRKLGPEARQLADTYFFETLVRTHRAAEGAPYTGLKPAGRDLGPAIPAADRALQSGNAAPLTQLLVDEVRAGVKERHGKALAARSFKPDDLEAGRKYVDAYVAYIHYVEQVHEAARNPAKGHYPESEPVAHDEK